MHIRKAVIPTAGFGTRFLPATKSIPKGIITVVDKPIILYIVEGLVASGIEQIILVTSSNSKPLEDFFDRNWELEAALERSGKTALLEQVRRIADIAEFAFVRQKQPLGNGHAVLMARNLVGDEPFVMVWGDDILLGDPPVPRQLMDVAEKYDAPVLAVRRVPIEQVAKYGMVQGEPVEGRVSRALSLVEKPKREQITSDLAQLGGYVLTPDIFPLLESTPIGPSGELYLADAVQPLLQQRPCYAYEFTGKRYDAGDKLDYLRATVELALADPALGPGFRDFLRSLELDDGRGNASPQSA